MKKILLYSLLILISCNSEDIKIESFYKIYQFDEFNKKDSFIMMLKLSKKYNNNFSYCEISNNDTIINSFYEVIKTDGIHQGCSNKDIILIYPFFESKENLKRSIDSPCRFLSKYSNQLVFKSNNKLFSAYDEVHSHGGYYSYYNTNGSIISQYYYGVFYPNKKVIDFPDFKTNPKYRTYYITLDSVFSSMQKNINQDSIKKYAQNITAQMLEDITK